MMAGSHLSLQRWTTSVAWEGFLAICSVLLGQRQMALC